MEPSASCSLSAQDNPSKRSHLEDRTAVSSQPSSSVATPVLSVSGSPLRAVTAAS